jgi:hypothetical protein
VPNGHYFSTYILETKSTQANLILFHKSKAPEKVLVYTLPKFLALKAMLQA